MGAKFDQERCCLRQTLGEIAPFDAVILIEIGEKLRRCRVPRRVGMVILPFHFDSSSS
jgi:hypothetical protein